MLERNASKVLDWCSTVTVSRDLNRLKASHVIMHCGKRTRCKCMHESGNSPALYL